MAAMFGCAPPLPNAEPRYNGSPSQRFMVIRFNPETRERRLDMLEWSLLPSWEKDPKSAYKRINAKAETVDTLPSFQAAFKERRCLVPVDAFYEWKGDKPGHKQPHALARKDHKPCRKHSPRVRDQAVVAPKHNVSAQTAFTTVDDLPARRRDGCPLRRDRRQSERR